MEPRDICVFAVARFLIDEYGVKAPFVAGYRMDKYARGVPNEECEFWGDVIRAIEVCSTDQLVAIH